ncbi:hypothetical protein [Bradyrhizobium sp.]
MLRAILQHHPRTRKGDAMSNSVTVGRRLVPFEQIALIEPFEPSTQNPLRSDREFKSRIILLNRDSILAEFEPFAFAEEHGFRMLLKDGTAANPSVHFNVERFEPSEGFQPSKPFRSRILWRDLDGNTQSKLLLTEADDVLAVVVRGEEVSSLNGAEPRKPAPKTPGRRRSRRRVTAEEPAPF